jgi:hypothetical protein
MGPIYSALRMAIPVRRDTIVWSSDATFCLSNPPLYVQLKKRGAGRAPPAFAHEAGLHVIRTYLSSF